VRVVVVAFSLRVFLRGEASTGDNGNEVGILVVGGEACNNAGGDTGAVATTVAATEGQGEEDDEVPAASEWRVSRRTLRPCCVACVTRSI
jgi:hypothetical protein